MAITPRSSPRPRTTAEHPIIATLEAYRTRIRRQRKVRYLRLAAIAVGAAWALSALVYYLNLASQEFAGRLFVACLAISVLLPLGALAFESARRPSIADTARMVDGLLDNQQRALTSMELVDERAWSRIGQAQLATTASMLAKLDPHASAKLDTGQRWSGWSLAVGLVMLALALYVLKGAGGFSPFQAATLPPDLGTISAAAPPTPLSGLPESEMTATSVAQSQQNQQTGGTPTAGAEQSAANPSDQAAASQDAQSALQRLSSALGEQSATQQAADSLRQGNTSQAAKQLAELGEQNDQLSGPAKQDLADSLEQAAQDPATNQALRDAEQQAANALRSGNYKDIEAALKNLADAAQQTAAGIVPQQELAQNFPTPSSSQSSGSQQSQDGGQGAGSESAQQGSQGSPGQGAGGQAGQEGEGQSGDGTAGSGDGEGQRHSPSAAGEGHRVSGPVDPARQSAGTNPFELESHPDPNNTRPFPQNNQPALTLGSGPGGSLPGAPSKGGAITTRGENNNLPVERWRVVERYFGK